MIFSLYTVPVFNQFELIQFLQYDFLKHKIQIYSTVFQTDFKGLVTDIINVHSFVK